MENGQKDGWTNKLIIKQTVQMIGWTVIDKESDVFTIGSTEVVEIAFSKVYIELSNYRSEALVLLTNYR